MKSDKISEQTTKRLSIYLRCLNELAAAGQVSVSSEACAKRFGLNSAQIRKDLANFGEFGHRGVGYNVIALQEHLIRILGLDRQHAVGIIGAGRLGTALADYYRILNSNFDVVALFDSDKGKIGKKVGDIEISDIKNFAAVAKRDSIEVAVIAVPAGDAQGIIEIIESTGIRAVMNFAPIRLRASADIKLKSVDMTTTLESLSYFLANDSQ